VELLSVAENIYLVPGENGGRFPFSHSIYVDAERKILFDVGIGPKALPAFLKEFKVDIVVVSHCHPDHIAGCGALADSAPIFVPQEGADTFGDLDLMAQRFAEGEEEQRLWKSLVTRVMGFTPARSTRTYDGRTAFDLGAVKLVAVHTPGHVRDHYCFYEESSGCMLLFDIDLSPGGPWYGNAESSIGEYEASLSLVRSFNPELVVSSHMGVLRKGVMAALDAFAARFAERDEMLLKMMETPQSIAEMAAKLPFTPRHHPALSKLVLYWESQMVRKHMDRLVETGRANPIRGKFVVAR